MSSTLRWFFDWPAPLVLILVGSLGLLWPTGILDGPREWYDRTYGDSVWDRIWFGAAPGALLCLVGALRLRVTIRRGDRDWL